MGGLGAWGGFLERLIKKLPIQDRKERWKNELDKLEKERAVLLLEKWDPAKKRRFSRISERIAVLNGWLRNSVND